MSGNDIPPCLIFIDKEGRWFHKGVEMVHRGFIRLFYEHMEIDPLGRYIINFGGDRCYVELEDTPFVVRRTVLEERGATNKSRFILFLNDDSQEDLFPDTLCVGDGDVLYCQVKNRTFPARFDRAAYYQLAKYIVEENHRFFLPFHGKKYPIRQDCD